jgi:hypothetical protein
MLTPQRGIDRVSIDGGEMSQINGDKARFQKNRRRKLRQRERTRALVAQLRATGDSGAAAATKKTRPGKPS